MIKTPITKERLKHHFRYNWYKYLVFGAITVFSISLLATVTRYIPPEDKRLDVLICSDFVSSELAEKTVKGLSDQLTYDPPIEELAVNDVLCTTDGSTEIALTSRILFSRDADILLLSETYYKQFAAQDIFTSLDELILAYPSLSEKNLSSGRVTLTDGDHIGDTHLYGIPLSSLPMLVDDMAIYSESGDVYLCLYANNGNVENAKKLFEALVTEGLRTDSTADSAD